ncbi:MAG TPA: YqgE/AlgH family protein [Methylocystis sp.]|nr:YqgE/AlgH family protein [Methylocystis sp.]
MNSPRKTQADTGAPGTSGESGASRAEADASRRRAQAKRGTKSDRPYLDGKILVAMPDMADERFARSVIYLCAHSAEGAMGIILNKPARVSNFPDLLEQLKILDPKDGITLSSAARDIQILSGGPVQTDRGFVLHSADFFIANSTLPIDEDVSLTTTIDILRAIATGKGPDRALLALGYAGWDAGQLENEIQLNGWLHCPADKAILFDRDFDTKYERALRSIGVDLANFVTVAGHG